jgi:hypothetical protein
MVGPVVVNDPEKVVEPVTNRDPFTTSLPITDSELESVVEPVTVKLPFATIGPTVEIEPEVSKEPVIVCVSALIFPILTPALVTCNSTADPDITVSEPVITVLPLFMKGPVEVRDPDKIVEPVTCKVLVPKVATRIFSTEIATDPLATWFIPLGFSPVYFIFY